jgi:hypothetical protein
METLMRNGKYIGSGIEITNWKLKNHYPMKSVKTMRDEFIDSIQLRIRRI